MSGSFGKEPRLGGVFRLRDFVLEYIYRGFEALGIRFKHRPNGAVIDYEKALERFYRQLPLDGCVVVDAGAHVGRHTAPLSQCVGPRGTVYAFEPIPEARRRLAAKLYKAQCHNVVMLPFALAHQSGFAEFCFVPRVPEESGLRRRDTYTRPGVRVEQIPVRVARLDEIIPATEHVRFLKVDVEGGELDVLRGAQGVLDRCRPIVAFECGQAGYRGYHDTPEEIFEILASRGYEVFSLTAVRVSEAEKLRSFSVKQDFWDYIAFPRDDAHLARFLDPLPG